MVSDNDCIRCGLPFNFPKMNLNEDGLCEVCQKFDKRWKPWLENEELRKNSEEELRKKLNKGSGGGFG